MDKILLEAVVETYKKICLNIMGAYRYMQGLGEIPTKMHRLSNGKAPDLKSDGRKFM